MFPSEGMPIPGSVRKGDMFIIFQVEMPDNEWLKGLDREVRPRSPTPTAFTDNRTGTRKPTSSEEA